ncbi:MAG: hypothetical protein ICV59_05905 [Thermoleophilia bacterium]|nr:hypothetical protein [Thermoleophilia bacterium]
MMRDFPRYPTLAELNAPYFARWTAMRDVLARGWRRRGRRRDLLLAAIAHSLDLGTWHSLVRSQGLGHDDAIRLLVGLVRGA